MWVIKWWSSWPIFHGPVILPYIWKTIWCMNIILWDYESVWPVVRPQNKCRSLWPIFDGPVILPSWRLFDVWTSYFGITSQYDPMFDLKINGSVRVAERLALPTSDHGVTGSNPTGGEILPEPKRRFIAQSLSCSPFHRLEMTEILSKGRKILTHPSIHQNKCWSLWLIFHGPVILPYILKTIWCMNILLCDYESVWHNIWLQNKCRSLTYISWSSDFALFLEEYLIYKHHPSGLWVRMSRFFTSKYL